MKQLFLAAALMAGAVPAVAQNDDLCGGAETPCTLEGGNYHLRMPEGWDGETALPVLIFYHGHRGNGRTILGNGGLVSDFSANGYILIAPNGARLGEDGPQSYPAREGSPRDDVAFTLAVLDDLETRVPVDRDHVYASGFSAGGSMAWLLACEAGDMLAGMVSVAGALREPNPTDCAGLEGLPILQVHGFADLQVPFEGRAIRDWHQGSLWDSLERALERNECRTHPDRVEIGETFRLRIWAESCEGGPVQLAVHDGGHGLPRGWTGMARDFFEANR
jgi:polyhydroxybutyrate depolymerase